MSTSEKLVAWGLLLTIVGSFCIYGFFRGWFSSHYTYTIEGGEGFSIAGLGMVIAGIVMIICGLT